MYLYLLLLYYYSTIYSDFSTIQQLVMNIPRLIEGGVRNYMQSTLNKCYDHRVQIYTFTFNVVVLIAFLGITGMTLWYCHSRKLSPQDRYKKQLKDQEYVLTKIRQFQMEKDIQRDQMSQLVRRVAPIEVMSIPASSMADHGHRLHTDELYSQIVENR